VRTTAALLIALAALLVGAPGAGALPLKARTVEATINELRGERGCGPLRVDDGLARAAGRQARLLLTAGQLDHDAGAPFASRLEQAAPAAHLWGENLAYGSGGDVQPAAIVAGWMNSPAHRAIMLDCRFSEVGVGIASGRFRGLEGSVYAADFAA
jgi:uncharacterized protein YkwD